MVSGIIAEARIRCKKFRYRFYYVADPIRKTPDPAGCYVGPRTDLDQTSCGFNTLRLKL